MVNMDNRELAEKIYLQVISQVFTNVNNDETYSLGVTKLRLEEAVNFSKLAADIFDRKYKD